MLRADGSTKYKYDFYIIVYYRPYIIFLKNGKWGYGKERSLLSKSLSIDCMIDVDRTTNTIFLGYRFCFLFLRENFKTSASLFLSHYLHICSSGIERIPVFWICSWYLTISKGRIPLFLWGSPGKGSALDDGAIEDRSILLNPVPAVLARSSHARYHSPTHKLKYFSGGMSFRGAWEYKEFTIRRVNKRGEEWKNWLFQGQNHLWGVTPKLYMKLQ